MQGLAATGARNRSGRGSCATPLRCLKSQPDAVRCSLSLFSKDELPRHQVGAQHAELLLLKRHGTKTSFQLLRDLPPQMGPQERPTRQGLDV